MKLYYNWRGHGNIGMKKWGNIISNRKRHGRILEFNIDIEYAWDLYVKQKGYCALTSLPIDFSNNHNELGTASLDRIDSAYGYVHDNVWWLHKDINRMKWTFTVDKFLELCKLIISNQGNKHE